MIAFEQSQDSPRNFGYRWEDLLNFFSSLGSGAIAFGNFEEVAVLSGAQCGPQDHERMLAGGRVARHIKVPRAANCSFR